MKKEMSIEEKLEYVRIALEMGANVDLTFHNIKTKAEAKKAAVELSKVANLSHDHKSYQGTSWYKIKAPDFSLETSIFFDDDYLEEDVDLSGSEAI